MADKWGWGGMKTVIEFIYLGSKITMDSDCNHEIISQFLLRRKALTDLHVHQETSLLFNMLSRFVIVFLPRSKRLLISWLQSLSIVILEPKKIKSTLFTSNE